MESNLQSELVILDEILASLDYQQGDRPSDLYLILLNKDRNDKRAIYLIGSYMRHFGLQSPYLRSFLESVVILKYFKTIE